MSSPIENIIVHLNAFPGTGKLTIARALCDKTGMRLMDNHGSANLIFNLINKDSMTKIPDEVWEAIHDVRAIVLENMVSLSPKSLSFVFTNCIFEGHRLDMESYKSVKDTAERRGGTYIPVVLTCSAEENRKRVGMPDRGTRMKMMSTERLDEMRKEEKLFVPNHPNLLEMDTTHIQPTEAAERIIAHVLKVTSP